MDSCGRQHGSFQLRYESLEIEADSEKGTCAFLVKKNEWNGHNNE